MTVRFWTWSHGASPGMSWNFPMWRLGYVKPLVRYVVPNPESLGENPPGTGTIYPTPTADDDGIGVFLANWVQYFTEQFSGVGKVFNDYCFCASSIGTSDTGEGRYVFGYSPDDDVTGAGADKKAKGPLHAAGSAYNVAQMTAAMAKFKSELLSRGLDFPTRFEYDGEHRPDLFSALTSGGTAGWMKKLIDGTEAKGGTEVMYDSKAFTTLWAARAKGDGSSSGFSYDDSLSITNNTNLTLFYWLEDFIWRTRDAVFKTAIFNPVRSAFPGLTCSNYDQYARKRGDIAPDYYPWHVVEYDYTSDIDLLSPVFYPLAPGSYSASAGYTIDDWLDALGITHSGDLVTNLRNITVARAKAIIDTIVNTGTTKRIVPWIPTMDYRESFAGYLGLDESVKWNLTAENIREIAEYCVANGVNEFFVFWGDATATESAITEFTDLARDLNTLRAELYTDDPVEGEDMALGNTIPAPAGTGNGAMLLRISGSTPWDTCIRAGGLVTADNANITNPTTQCTQSTTSIIKRQGRTPGVLELRMGYTTGLTWTASAVLRVFGRNSSGEGWTLLKNRAGSITATFPPGGTTDVSDGTLRYTTVDQMEHVWDVHGYEEILVGVQIAPTLDTGSPTAAIMQYKLTDRPKEQPNFVDAGVQKYAVIDAATFHDTTIVAAVTGKRIRVLAAHLVASGGANTVRFESGTGGTALTGQMSLAANGVWVLPYNEAGWFQTASAALLNLELSAATSVDGGITYVEVD